MRHVLVDYARDRLRQKRGGAAVHIPIDAAVILSSEQVEQIVAVDLALQRLAENEARKSRVFEMRFFGGLTVDEVAEALGVAPNTVIRDWEFARAWLRRELGVIVDSTVERWQQVEEIFHEALHRGLTSVIVTA